MLQRFKPTLLELCAVGAVGDRQTKEEFAAQAVQPSACDPRVNLPLHLLLLLLQSSATNPCASRVVAVARKVGCNCMLNLLAVQPAEAQTLQLLPCI
jgi:hypothetical protein